MGGGAQHLADIFGTEQDRVNCPFYLKMGACRHGDRCSRAHVKPKQSCTLLLNMYQSPEITPGQAYRNTAISKEELQKDLDAFYEDVFKEVSKHGKVEALKICNNFGNHLAGNVYVQFRHEEHAVAAMAALNGRFYSGRPIAAEFSPVTDFREASCRQEEQGGCSRGGCCNFLHLYRPSRALMRELMGDRSSSPPRRDHRRRPREEDGERDHKRRPREEDGERDYRRDGERHTRRSPPWRRESDRERLAKIERWNKEREKEPL
ncbi:hypothetical protein SELMODRAFT_123490 [Selaginella moellendorffii]|uniref:Uncharacterized protein n=1 Tax=Selaginella moellendorffii TaxID=88036 RepID=D8SRU6_SELML|nr:splicing factor U2af small subunit B [Selaginella moellendorffii]EFJ12916.1 hypothetical protein SELMODRAFT_123490 [Selaginella moellendorffii]|eukprot:XP_002986097.1 splicing factor U2af small subunit B [Selaginella moellendorffii]